MLSRELHAATVGTADHERHLHLTTGEVPDLGSMIDDLVYRQEREVHGYHLDYRPHTHHRHADGCACETVLGDGGVDDPLRAKSVEEAVGDELRTAVDADILAHQHDVVIPLHLLAHGLPESLTIGLLGHGLTPPLPCIRLLPHRRRCRVLRSGAPRFHQRTW